MNSNQLSVKEYPILFSGEMVRAILEGRKTQTRRVMNPQPSFDGVMWSYPGFDDYWFDVESMCMVLMETDAIQCPYGYAYADGTGDRLWVREAWQAINQQERWWHEVKREDRLAHNWVWTNPVQPSIDLVPPRWLPSIHMPRMACRLVMDVAGVKVERVQDITEEDAVAEGVENSSHLMMPKVSLVNGSLTIDRFARLWDSINGKRGFGWDVNPFVWAVEFVPPSKPLPNALRGM